MIKKKKVTREMFVVNRLSGDRSAVIVPVTPKSNEIPLPANLSHTLLTFVTFLRM